MFCYKVCENALIKIDLQNRIPKYKQIVKSVQQNIMNRYYIQGDQLPSVNTLCDQLQVARDTVIKAYKELATTGIITSMPGKGYYVSKSTSDIKHHVFLLFDLFLPFKKAIYNSFIESLGKNTVVDIYFHHYNPELYKKLIIEAKGQYTDFVIMPLEGEEQYVDWFDMILGDENVYILDLGIKQYGKKYPSLCQNFRKAWYNSFCSLNDKIKKYDKFILTSYKGAISDQFSRPHDMEMEEGFISFCKDYNIDYHVVSNSEKFEIRKNECYMIPDDNEMVKIIVEARDKGYQLGLDIGIISHNESPMKSIICTNGITTISTDFGIMGQNLADMIINGRREHLEANYTVFSRNSI